jgi:hypothetical protein
MPTVQEAKVGDVIIESGGRVGRKLRTGEILEVRNEHEHPEFRVRWDDDRETIYIPGSDVEIHRYEDEEQAP